jgi:hypothetical protein
MPKTGRNSIQIQTNKQYSPEDVDHLKQLNESFLKKYYFEKNQIVKWKPALRNRLFPLKNQPAIVVDLLKEPVFNSDRKTGSPYFREPLDIILGFIDEQQGYFITFYYDSRRFKPYN